MTHIARIRAEGKHEEQPAQNVLSFGHPGHRFGPQRMDGEDDGHEGTGPEIPGHLPQHEEEEDRRGGVK